MRVIAISIGLTVVLLCQAAMSQLSKCDEAEVEYRSAPANLESKIRVSKPTTPSEVSAAAKKIFAPQGTSWFVEIAPDYTSVAKPWNTTLQIGTHRGNGILLQADFLDHGNTFAAQWINEELLFVEVWWGRFGSSDLILNVRTGKFIYDKFAHYGELAAPCDNN